MINPNPAENIPALALTLGPFSLCLQFSHGDPYEVIPIIRRIYQKFLIPQPTWGDIPDMQFVQVLPEVADNEEINVRAPVQFDRGLRHWTAQEARRRGGFLLHAAGVICRGKGWLLPGRSGAGKSTLASRLAPVCELVLSDESCVALPVEGGWKLWGTPFYGTGEQGITGPGAPLEAILFPSKARALQVTTLKKDEALARLLRTPVIPEKTSDENVLTDAISLVGAQPCLDVEFSLGTDIVEVTDAIRTALPG